MAASNNKSVEKRCCSINLDCFWDLAETNRSVRIKAAERLLNSLIGSRKEGTFSSDFAYSIDRLIKGLGSPRKAARQGFTLVLTQILRSFPEVNLKDILKQVENHLPLTGKKHDTGNNAIGQALAFSAVVHSGKLKDNPDCISDTVVSLLSLYEKRSYIQQINQRLFQDIFKQLNKDTFKEHVWPHLKKNLKMGWECCTPDNLWLLFICSQSYPDILGRKFLKKYWNTPDILDKDNCVHIAKIIKQSTVVHPHVHPVCTEIVRAYLKKEDFKEFWRIVIDENLFVSGQGDRIYLGFEVIKMILPVLKHQKQVQSIFLPNFCQAFMRCILNHAHPLNSAASDMGDHLARFVSVTEDPAIQILILEIFLKSPGSLLFDKLTKKKTLANIVSYLKTDAVKLYTDMLKAIFLGKGEDRKSDTSNHDKLRSFAIHQMSVLLGHPAMSSDITWKREIVQFLLMHSLFNIRESHIKIPESSDLPVEISPGLRKDCRISLSRALELLLKSTGPQKSHMEEKCEIMVSLLQYTDQVLNLDDNFSFIADITLIKESWSNVQTMVRKLQKQHKKNKELLESYAFQILFVHLALQLLIDPHHTSDILQDLQECCKHALNSRLCKDSIIKDETTTEENIGESQWIEVIVDLLLSLLSHPSHLARSVVMSAFPLFCPFLTTAALDQIVDVINPEKCSEEGLVQLEEDDNDEPSSKSSNSEDEDNDEPTVSEEFRHHIKLALGQAGEDGDDSEHYLSDSEMCKLDDALAAAFSSQRPVNRRKPTKEEVDLLHFRLRCLDLLFILLKSGPSLNQVIRLIFPLVSTLEYGLQDKHQLCLVEKIKRLLQIIVKHKKWPNTIGVNQEDLKTLLQFLMAKAKKASDMQVQRILSQLCAYVVLCSKKLHNITKENVSVIQDGLSEHWYIEDYKLLLKDYFENRVKNIDTEMFSSLISNYPETVWEFTDLLLEYAFHENTRLYKRTQMLGILLVAVKAIKTLSTLTADEWKKFCSKLIPPVVKAIQDIINSQEVKTTYTTEILEILAVVANISMQFDVNILQSYDGIKNLQNLTSKQRQKLQKKERKVWRKVSKIIGQQN